MLYLPTDTNYIKTKLILQGKRQMNPIFQELSLWIFTKYDLQILNICYDLIDNNQRLNIILKNQDALHKIDTIKSIEDKINKKLNEIVTHHSKANSSFYASKLIIVFSVFSYVAVQEAIIKITSEFIPYLINKYANTNLWHISTFGNTATIFFLTEDDIQKNSTNENVICLVKEFKTELKKYDEFSLITDKDIFITFDSKENFDKNYQSKWYYYYK